MIRTIHAEAHYHDDSPSITHFVTNDCRSSVKCHKFIFAFVTGRHAKTNISRVALFERE